MTTEETFVGNCEISLERLICLENPIQFLEGYDDDENELIDLARRKKAGEDVEEQLEDVKERIRQRQDILRGRLENGGKKPWIDDFCYCVDPQQLSYHSIEKQYEPLQPDRDLSQLSICGRECEQSYR